MSGLVCNSQTIINAERLNHEDSLVVALSFLYNGNYGNTTTNQFGITPIIAKIGINNDYKLFGGYNILRSGTETLLNSGFVHARHNYKLTDKLKTFEFYQLQFNELILLNKREVFGVGLQYSIIPDTTLTFSLGSGIIQENEFLNPRSIPIGEKLNTFYIRVTFVGNFEWNINDKLRLNNVVYYQPYVNNIKDYRLLNDFNLSISIIKNISFILSSTLRYDNESPSTLKPIDLVNSIELNFSF